MPAIHFNVIFSGGLTGVFITYYCNYCAHQNYYLSENGQSEKPWYMLSLTFCLSSIFMAKYCSVPLCFTSITLPNDPVPKVFNLSKSSRHVVLCENNNLLAYSVKVALPKMKFSSFLPVVGIPISVRNLLWLWLETLSLKKEQIHTYLAYNTCPTE